MSLLIKNAIIVNADKLAKKPQDILIDKGIISRSSYTRADDQADSATAAAR